MISIKRILVWELNLSKKDRSIEIDGNLFNVHTHFTFVKNYTNVEKAWPFVEKLNSDEQLKKNIQNLNNQ